MTAPLAIALLLLAGWKAETADLELAVPEGWQFDPNVVDPSPTVRSADGSCTNSVTFDFIPGSSVDYAQRLIASESLKVTASVRRWDVDSFRLIPLAHYPASVLRLDRGSV